MLFRQRIRLLLVGAGALLLVAAGIVTASAMPPSQEEGPPNLDADYVGSGTCMMCHTQDDVWLTTGHAQMVRAPGSDTVLGDLSDTAAVTITWPDGSEHPITAEDVTYVLGGRYVQQYVSVLAREDGTPGYFVLPVQWNVPQSEDQTGTWSPYHPDDWQDPSRDWRVACAGCHTTGLNRVEAPGDTTAFAFMDARQPGEIELNIGCEACHGPGSEHMGQPGTLVVSPDAQICGQCHVQGQAPDGVHGYPIGYQPGLPLDESKFVITPPEDEAVWLPDGHARVYNQYGEWLTSSHAQTVAMAEICARCHGTARQDDTWNMSTVIDGVTCVACHDPHASALRVPVNAITAPGAVPAAAPTEAPTEEAATPIPDEEVIEEEATEAPNLDDEEEATEEPLPTPEPVEEDDEAEAPILDEEDEEAPAATPTPAPIAAPFSWAATPTPDSSGGAYDSFWSQRVMRIDTAANPRVTIQRQELPLDYPVCIACHNSRTLEGEALLIGGELHHPNQEMFEGWQMVEGLPGIPSAHFLAEGGPLCATCHMPDTVPIGELARVSSHTMQPVLPGTEIEPDSCSGCHANLSSRPALQQFIDDTQAGTAARLTAVDRAARNDAPDWIYTIIDFVEGDSSRGIHNSVYTDALLDAAEAELGLVPSIDAARLPDQPVPDLPDDLAEPDDPGPQVADIEADGGLTTPSIILLAICGVIIAAAAYAFFIREAENG